MWMLNELQPTQFNGYDLHKKMKATAFEEQKYFRSVYKKYIWLRQGDLIWPKALAIK